MATIVRLKRTEAAACPWCGRQPVLWNMGMLYWVECSPGHAVEAPQRKTRQGALDAWNGRALR